MIAQGYTSLQPRRGRVPSTPAGLAEGRAAFEASEPLAAASKGLKSTLSFMRSYSLILAKALSK